MGSSGRSPAPPTQHTGKSQVRMDIRGEYEFSVFIKKAVFSGGSDSYVELYNMLLRSFVAADADLDGKVTDSEFSQLIAAASEFPRKFGRDWWSSGEDTSKLFRSIDENNDGAISFNEWLAFALQTYAARSRELAKVPEDMNREEFLNLCSEDGKKNPEALRSIYFYQLNFSRPRTRTETERFPRRSSSYCWTPSPPPPPGS